MGNILFQHFHVIACKGCGLLIKIPQGLCANPVFCCCRLHKLCIVGQADIGLFTVQPAEGRVVFKAVKDGFKHVGLRPGNFIAYKAAVLHLLQL